MNIKNRLRETLLKITGFILILFQYIPITSIWYGVMSLPLISFLVYFFQQPGILIYELPVFLRSFECYITLFGTLLFIYSFIILVKNRKTLFMKGPYKYIRHPQYLGIIIMTFGLTLLSVDSGPLNPTYPISSNEFFKRSWILYMWIAEVILYIILAKIEDLSLKAKYGENFLNFAKIVPFMFPVLNLYKDRKDKKSKDQLISKN